MCSMQAQYVIICEYNFHITAERANNLKHLKSENNAHRTLTHTYLTECSVQENIRAKKITNGYVHRNINSTPKHS